jgi:integrase
MPSWTVLGLRISELLGLRVSDVDFLRRVVHVTEQLSEDGKRRVPLKTANSRRSVPLAPECAELLAEHLRAYPAAGGGWLFTVGSATASPLRRKQAWQAYRGAVVAAGLPDSTSSHDLRHHFASVLLHAGESVHAVTERLGDTPQMVLNVYGHLMPGQEDRTRHAISAAWQAARTTAAVQAR